jgi:hypothetical protein
LILFLFLALLVCSLFFTLLRLFFFELFVFAFAFDTCCSFADSDSLDVDELWLPADHGESETSSFSSSLAFRMLCVGAAFVSLLGCVMCEELDDLRRFRLLPLPGVLAREEVGEGSGVLLLRDEGVFGDLMAGGKAMAAGLFGNDLVFNLT